MLNDATLAWISWGLWGSSDTKPTPQTKIAPVTRQTPWVKCSPEGAGFLNLNILRGQAGVSGMTKPGSRVWRIEVRYQADDRRFIRGTRGIPKEEE